MSPRPQKPLQPITDYEVVIWEVWDRLEKAVMSDLSRWDKRANEAFLELLRLDRRAYAKSAAAYNVAKGGWLIARGHGAEVREAEMALIEDAVHQREQFKAQLRQQQKDILKAAKAAWRAEKKAQKAKEKAA